MFILNKGQTITAAMFPHGLAYETISIRRPKNAHKYHRLDEEFFTTIDSEYKAYWLGFITADGCVHKNTLSLHLSNIDENHLRKLLDNLHATQNIINNTNSCGLQITSTLLVESLRMHGVSDRKSFTVKPYGMNPCLLRHYWRGVVDGDGLIKLTKTGVSHLGLVGNKHMTQGFLDFVRTFTHTKSSIKPHSTIYSIRFCGTNICKEIAQILYGDCTVALDRKLKVARTILSIPSRRHRRK